MASHSFYVVDYVVFGLTIAVSLGIGIFYAFSGGKQKTTSEYLVGGRSMSFFPVAISLLVSFESSIMMLGLPAEGYVYGIQYFWTSVGWFTSQMMSIVIMVPLIHPLKITSAYEYLQLRFQSRAVRLCGTMLGMLTYVWYMGIVLFGPAIALEAVTGFPMWTSIFVISLVSVIYTSIGGLKAVIWTDVFQALIMFMGIFAILIKGTMDAGGVAEVWNTAEKGGRLNFFDFDTDVRTRHTFWNLYLGTIVRGFGLVFNQSTVQRISSTRTISEAKKVLAIVAPIFLISLTMSIYEGIVMYAYYNKAGCDPFESKALKNPNQIVPYAVMDVFVGLPGMPGLFLAALFSASLSTLSSGLSSLSALLWADIVQPLVGDISDAKATIIAKVSVVVFGMMASGIAVLVSLIGGPMTQIAGSLLSAFSGPLTALFFLGCFCPRVNSRGALLGGIVGAAVSIWIAMGMNFNKRVKKTPWLPPASIENCPVDGFTFNITDELIGNVTSKISTTTSDVLTTISLTTDSPQLEGIEQIYTISYNWISIIGIFLTMFISFIASILLGQNKPGDVDPRYLVPVSNLFLFLPSSVRSQLASIGPQFMKEEYKDKFPDPALKHTGLNVEMEIMNEVTEDLLPEEKEKINKE